MDFPNYTCADYKTLFQKCRLEFMKFKKKSSDLLQSMIMIYEKFDDY